MNTLDRYRISLRITHPNIKSEEVSKGLGLVPKIAYSAGDKKLTPKGNEIPGIRKESFWCYELPLTDMPIESTMTTFTAKLVQRKDFLRRLTETGGCLEYFVGWFSSGNSGFVLSPSLLGTLVDAGIGLSFDIYPAN